VDPPFVKLATGLSGENSLAVNRKNDVCPTDDVLRLVYGVQCGMNHPTRNCRSLAQLLLGDTVFSG